jgi:hypothetical protein
MLHRSVALFLVLALSIPLAANDGTQVTAESPQAVSTNRVRDQISQIVPGTLIAVRFTDGSKARGYLSQVESDGFSYKIGDGPTGDQRRATFDSVRSVKVVRLTRTHPVAWIVTGVILAAVIAVLIGFLIERHNEGG